MYSAFRRPTGLDHVEPAALPHLRPDAIVCLSSMKGLRIDWRQGVERQVRGMLQIGVGNMTR